MSTERAELQKRIAADLRNALKGFESRRMTPALRKQMSDATTRVLKKYDEIFSPIPKMNVTCMSVVGDLRLHVRIVEAKAPHSEKLADVIDIGTHRSVQMNPCVWCKGSGGLRNDFDPVCTRCKGTGVEP